MFKSRDVSDSLILVTNTCALSTKTPSMFTFLFSQSCESLKLIRISPCPDHLIVGRIEHGNILEFKAVKPKHTKALYRRCEPGDLCKILQEFANKIVLNGWNLQDQKGRYQEEKNSCDGVSQYFLYPIFNNLQFHLSTHESHYTCH